MIVFRPISTWDPEFLCALHAHYSGSAGAPPGKKLAWEIVDRCARTDCTLLQLQSWFRGLVEHDHHLGWIGLGEPAFKLAPRRELGLEHARPQPRTVCCFVYRLDSLEPIETRVHYSAGDLLRLWHPVAAEAWRREYGWAPEHWETLIDPTQVRSTNPGACFKRAGYRTLGWTTGRSARRPPGATHRARVWSNSTPKLVLYKGPLARKGIA